MSNITETARTFFDAYETGQGWATCRAYCMPEATFAAQSEALASIRTLEQCTDWMKGLLGILPDGRYEIKSFATDEFNQAADGLRFRPNGFSQVIDRPKMGQRFTRPESRAV